MYTEIDGLKVRYITEGEGENLVLLHGWGGKLESFRPIFDALRADFRVTAIDFPAHGESDKPKTTWDVDDYAGFTLKLLGELDVFPCHVAAHSFGGRVTIAMAAERPEAFKKLVMTGAAGLLPKPTLKSRIRKAIYNVFMKIASQKLKDRLRDRFSSADYKALSPDMKKTFVKVINQDLRPRLGQIKSPTLLIWGSHDQDTPIYYGQTMVKEIPDAGLVVFEGCGHFAYLERQGDFIKITRHFLKGEGS
ncbi:MAG: alpha/beta fold hydrolase [Christensenellales bacterium]